MDRTFFRRAAAAAALLLGTAAAGAGTRPLAEAYARYLAAGRSDVEIHLAPGGSNASARIRPLGDGAFRCDVQGLRPGLPGVLVHEVTHCLVGPYLAPVRDAAATPADDRLVLLTSESISDARAVIEVFRADGAAAAQALVAAMLPQREAAASPGHATAHALRAALARVHQAPPVDAQAAFGAALDIGRASALQTLREQFSAADVSATAALLDAALAQARRAFAQGRHANDAVTLHATAADGGSDNRHWYIGPDGRLRDQASLGAEGAHGLVALQALMEAATPEQRLAARWLARQGKLDAPVLERTALILGRFLRTFGDRAAAVLQAVIDEAPRQADLSDVLDEAAQRLR